MIIGITETLGSETKFEMYLRWLSHGSQDISFCPLSYRKDNLAALQECNALVLTGGHDVSPELYGGPANHPLISEVDRRRDSFERSLLGQSIEAGIPILGICRGMQLANVHFGGSLIPDLEERGFPTHRSDTEAVYHQLLVEPETMLARICGGMNGEVNSSHHQGVDAVGAGLRVAGRAADGLIEALEYERPESKPFFLLIQWHPERMEGIGNPLSSGIIKRFHEAIASSQSHAA